MSEARLRQILGQKSWTLKSDTVKAHVTRRGGHLGPVIFDRRARAIAPYSVAPWAEEKVDKATPAIIRVLRGDFFCCPFGGNATPYKDEQHPVHGETANAKWELVGLDEGGGETTLHLRLRTTIRSGVVDKRITLVDGHNAVYTQHVLSEMQGPMTLGHHAMLRFPEAEGSGLIATSPFAYGQVFVEPVEQPAAKGYSILKPGAAFTDLAKVPRIDGRKADLSRYPARRGYEDLVMVMADPKATFAWTAVSFPAEGYVWFALKDPRVLTGTALWMSNGGRHYPPWSGRHVNVMGLEDVTGYFHYGLAESAAKNPIGEQGYKTRHLLRADRPLTVNYIQGIAVTPEGFGRVASIVAGDDPETVIIAAEDGQSVTVGCRLGFLGG